MLMATFIVPLMTLFSEEDFLSWGWRIPFLLSSVLVLLGPWIRKGHRRDARFQEGKASGQVAKRLLRDCLKHLLAKALIAAGLEGGRNRRRSISFRPRVVELCHHARRTNQKIRGAPEAVTLGAHGGHRDDPLLMGLLSDKVGRQAHARRRASSSPAQFIVPWFMLPNTRQTVGIVLATVNRPLACCGAPVTAVPRHAVL